KRRRPARDPTTSPPDADPTPTIHHRPDTNKSGTVQPGRSLPSVSLSDLGVLFRRCVCDLSPGSAVTFGDPFLDWTHAREPREPACAEQFKPTAGSVAKRIVRPVKPRYEDRQSDRRTRLTDKFQQPAPQAMVVALGAKFIDQLIDMLASK